MQKMGGTSGQPFLHGKLIMTLFLHTISSGVATLAYENACTRVQSNAYGAENMALQHVSYGNTVAQTRMLCARDCQADTRCKSFNYRQSNRSCELNAVTRAQHPCNFNKSADSVYFDGDKETPMIEAMLSHESRHSSCKRLQQARFCTSGEYYIYPEMFSNSGLQVYCDMETAGGGWIMIQRRQDGIEDFYRDWTDYEAGFGDLSGEFWLGNDNIQKLTLSGGSWKLRFDFEDWEGNTAWAEYLGFHLSGSNYKMEYADYNTESTAGDSLQNGVKFSTKDRDNDPHLSDCAEAKSGGWWYVYCGNSNPNGMYYRYPNIYRQNGILWDSMKVKHYSMKACTIKMSEL